MGCWAKEMDRDAVECAQRVDRLPCEELRAAEPHPRRPTRGGEAAGVGGDGEGGPHHVALTQQRGL